MLAIRMQRTGRRGHAMFRVIVQDARRTPTSGKVVARIGSYDPHAKAVILDKEKAAFYLEHGAQPSERVARLLKDEGIKLPAWVKLAAKKESAVRNPDKRRSTRPPEAEAPAKPELAAEPEAEAPAESADAPAADQPAEESKTDAEQPAEAAASSDEKPETPEPAAETPAAEEAAPADADTKEAAEPEAPAEADVPAEQPADKPEA